MSKEAFTISQSRSREMSLDALQERIKKNKQYKQLLESFKTQKIFKVPLEKFKDEIFDAHSTRNVRVLVKHADDNTRIVDQLVKANLVDQGVRSRLTEIMMTCRRGSAALQEAIKNYKNYASLRFERHLKSFKTKSERMSALDICLDDLNAFIFEAEHVYNLAELVVKDIDQAGFTLKRTQEVVAMHHAPERKM